MSQDTFADFLGKLNTDESLRAALAERFGDLSGDIPANDLITFAGDQGYSFDVEEAEGALSEEALEGVAGGLHGEVFPKVEIGLTSGYKFEEIKVTYSPRTLSFNFLKMG